MSKMVQKGAPVIKPEKVTANHWKANKKEVEVKGGEWVIFDSEGRPGRLWFPFPDRVVGDEIRDLGNGPVTVQTRWTAGMKKIVPYVFFLTEVSPTGEFLVGNSPPYIKIQDPTGGTRGVGNDPE